MFRNYLKVAFRNIRKYKIYSLINISGLAIGMACCVLIMLFIQDELSYDRYHEKADRIYRLVDSFDAEGELSRDFALSSAPFAPTLIEDFPEVEDAVRLLPRRHLVSLGEKKFYEDGLIYADASIFNIFTYPLVQGNPETALDAPYTVVVSELTARKYFGRQEAMNKTLSINEQDYLVTGIMKEIPRQSHFFTNMIASLKTHAQNPALQERFFQNWARHEFYTYLLLQEGFPYEDLQAKLPGFIEKHASQQVKSTLGSSLYSRLQPLTSIHLHSHLQHEISPNGDIKYVYIFSVIALFILLIACINFMNLATARAANRSKEVGLRKVVGAGRHQLVRQFLGESLLYTLFSLFVGLVVVAIALPSFYAFTGKVLGMNILENFNFLGFLVLILIFVGLTSGMYPAFFLSQYQPANVLKGIANVGSRRSLLRKGLVVFQFSISIILIIATAVVMDQLDFLRNRKLGFDKEHVVVIPIRNSVIRRDAETIKADLMQNPNIVSATIAIGVPGGDVAGDSIHLLTEEGKKTLSLRMIYTDHDYLKTMGMELVEGRDFSKNMSTDATEAFIINESAVRQLQLDDPLSKQFEWDDKKGKVIGVVRDFQFQSLKDEINPLVIHIWPANTHVFAMRIRPETIPETLAFIERKWNQLDPAHPFEYSFLDETFDELYKNEERLSQIFTVFSLLAIVIASLGLFGLALFMIAQRTKEIGIRKVLGASMGTIFLLLSKEFALLVLTANVVAWPAAYLLMRQWLQTFAYRVNMAPRVFVLSALAAFVIAVLTISVHSLKVATANPADSLRYE